MKESIGGLLTAIIIQGIAVTAGVIMYLNGVRVQRDADLGEAFRGVVKSLPVLLLLLLCLDISISCIIFHR